MAFKNQLPNKAIVVGLDHHNTLGLIRSLGESGVVVVAVIFDDSKPFVGRSKYVKECYSCESSETSLLATLMNLKCEYKPVIIPSCDLAVMLLNRIESQLKEHFYTDHFSGFDVAFYANKKNIIDIAVENGVKTPKTFVFSKTEQEDGSTYQIASNIDCFPLIVKPTISASSSKELIFTASDASQLQSKLAQLPSGDYLIQELITIDEEYGIQGIVHNQSDTVIVPAIIRKIRTSISAPGSTTYAEISEKNISFDLEPLKKMLLAIGFSGIFDLEFMRSGNDYYLIEINFRNGAYGYAYTKYGYNLALEWYKTCIRKSVDQREAKHHNTMMLINETADFAHVKKGNVNIFAWLIQLLKSKVKMLWNVKDLGPFFAKIIKK